MGRPLLPGRADRHAGAAARAIPRRRSRLKIRLRDGELLNTQRSARMDSVSTRYGRDALRPPQALRRACVDVQVGSRRHFTTVAQTLSCFKPLRGW